MTLDDLDLLALQPAFLREDPVTRAVCRALQPTFTELGEAIRHILIYTNIDNLEGPVLDELAWGWGIGWYSPTDTLAARRAVVKSAFRVFRRMGTAGALRDAVEASFGDAIVQEWWEYGVSPGYFRVLVTDQQATTSKAAALGRTIEQVKNVRSWLDEIFIIRTWETILNNYATWQDVFDSSDSWQDVLGSLSV